MTNYRYTVILRDANEQPIIDCGCDTIKDAVERARYMLTDDYAQHGETTQVDLGVADAIVVKNETGECVHQAWPKR